MFKMLGVLVLAIAMLLAGSFSAPMASAGVNARVARAQARGDARVAGALGGRPVAVRGFSVGHGCGVGFQSLGFGQTVIIR